MKTWFCEETERQNRETAFCCKEGSREAQKKRSEDQRDGNVRDGKREKHGGYFCAWRSMYGCELDVSMRRGAGREGRRSQVGECQAGKEEAALSEGRSSFCAGEPWDVRKRERKRRIKRAGVERRENELLSARKMESRMKLCNI